MTIFIRNAKIAKELLARRPPAETRGTALTDEPIKETHVATAKPIISSRRVSKKTPTLRKWQHYTKEEQAEKAAFLEAAKLGPPEVVLNLATYPTRLKNGSIVAHCTAMGNPGVKQRPRFVRANGTVFTPKETIESEREIGWVVKLAMRELLLDESSAFGMRLVFYVRDGQRKDIDNMTKLVFDGITGIAWHDDSQVKELLAWVLEDPVHPRTEILIYKLGYAVKEYQVCHVCSARFRVYPSWRGRPYCSKACSAFAQRNRVVMTCSHCQKQFDCIQSLSNENREYFCSRECYSLHHTEELTCAYCEKVFRRAQSLIKRGQNAYCSKECLGMDWNRRKTSPALGICQTCSGPITKKHYKQCKGCQTAQRHGSQSRKKEEVSDVLI